MKKYLIFLIISSIHLSLFSQYSEIIDDNLIENTYPNQLIIGNDLSIGNSEHILKNFDFSSKLDSIEYGCFLNTDNPSYDRYIFTYENSKLINALRVYNYGEEWVNFLNYQFEYENGNLSSESVYSWSSDKEMWVTWEKNEYEYDEYNRLVIYNQMNSDGDLNWENDYRKTYKYDENNLLETKSLYWDYWREAWDTCYQVEYEYDELNKTITRYSRPRFDGHCFDGSHITPQNYKSTEYFNTNQGKDSTIIMTSFSDSWDLDSRITYEYLKNEIVEHNFQVNKGDNEIQLKYKKHYLFDAYGNPIEQIDSVKEGIDLISTDKYIYEYETSISKNKLLMPNEYLHITPNYSTAITKEPVYFSHLEFLDNEWKEDRYIEFYFSDITL
jgi:hypothetical protein